MTNSERDFTLENGVLRFNGEGKKLCTTVQGSVINSVPSRKRRDELRPWKDKVALAVKADRGGAPWNPDHLYAVTLQYRFHRHPNQKLDVDNYVKPVLDGLAAGLFLPEDKDPSDRRDLPTYAAHHGVDDSNFRILLIRRLRNAATEEEERVHLFVSTTGHPPPG